MTTWPSVLKRILAVIQSNVPIGEEFCGLKGKGLVQHHKLKTDLELGPLNQFGSLPPHQDTEDNDPQT